MAATMNDEAGHDSLGFSSDSEDSDDEFVGFTAEEQNRNAQRLFLGDYAPLNDPEPAADIENGWGKPGPDFVKQLAPFQQLNTLNAAVPIDHHHQQQQHNVNVITQKDR